MGVMLMPNQTITLDLPAAVLEKANQMAKCRFAVYRTKKIQYSRTTFNIKW